MGIKKEKRKNIINDIKEYFIQEEILTLEGFINYKLDINMEEKNKEVFKKHLNQIYKLYIVEEKINTEFE